MRTPRLSLAFLVFALGALTWSSASRLAAHEIPNDVTIRMFFKPEGRRLRVLVRAPLEAMNDIDWKYRGPGGLLDLTRIASHLEHAATLWLADNIRVREDDAWLAAPRIAALRASLPSDQAFQSYEQALALVLGPPLPPDADVYKNVGMLDVLFEYAITSERSSFSVHPRLARLGLQTLTILRAPLADGVTREFDLHGDPGLVRLDPRWYHAAQRFTWQGFSHILNGFDHVLFLFCLVLPLRRVRTLVLVATAFTVAHSITLVAAAYQLTPSALWFPPLVEALVATSILYMALENLVGPRLDRRWLVAFGFGLVHGFSFSLALRDSLQFGGSHLLTSLLAFNLGLEIGQILLLIVMVSVLRLGFTLLVAERMGTIVISMLIAHTAWHWVMAGYGRLFLFRFGLPVVDAAFLAATLRWLMLLVIAAGAGWAISTAVGRTSPRQRAQD